MRCLSRFFLQSLHKDNKPDNIGDYANPTLAKCQANYNHTHEAYLEFSMLLSLDRSIYGKLVEYLSNSYSMGTDHYPQMRANMHDTIVNWRNRAACYGLRSPPGDVVFTQDNKKGPTSGKMHANGGQKELRDLSTVKCFKF